MKRLSRQPLQSIVLLIWMYVDTLDSVFLFIVHHRYITNNQATKLKINLAETLKPVPPSESLVFGQVRSPVLIL
jgi:hypothetical protein